MASKWTHNICSPCWVKRDPSRVPVTVRGAGTDLCCFCGAENNDGIYVRQDATTVPCEGKFMMHTDP